MIILIGSQKSGCGKSTTCVNIVSELVRQGKDMVLVDADRQIGLATKIMPAISNWIHSIQKFDTIRERLLDLKARYSYFVVDTAGRDSREVRTDMTAADIILVPFRQS